MKQGACQNEKSRRHNGLRKNSRGGRGRKRPCQRDARQNLPVVTVIDRGARQTRRVGEKWREEEAPERGQLKIQLKILTELITPSAEELEAV